MRTAHGADSVVAREVAADIRSDRGSEFIAEVVIAWITGVGARTAYIEKASPWEIGYAEFFSGKLRDERLNGEVFNTLREAQVLIEEWRRHYNQVRVHSSLDYRPPAPETMPMAKSQVSSGAGAAALTLSLATAPAMGRVFRQCDRVPETGPPGGRASGSMDLTPTLVRRWSGPLEADRRRGTV